MSLPKKSQDTVAKHIQNIYSLADTKAQVERMIFANRGCKPCQPAG